MNFKNVSSALVATVVVLLSACTVVASPVTSSFARKIGPSSKAVTMLSDGPYVGQMAGALSDAGFTVTAYVPGRQLTTRYGVRFNIEVSQTLCVFTSNLIGEGTLLLVDLQSGETVLTVKQRGATGSCTSVDPVYPGIASELGKHWQAGKEKT